MKKVCMMICIGFLLNSCNNNNIFSWARTPLKKNSRMIVSQGNILMDKRDFKGAKEEYRNAIEVQNDPETVMLYATALINEIFGCNFSEIVVDLSSNNGRGMLDILSHEMIDRANRDLWELVKAHDFFPSVFESSIPPSDSDTNLNGAVVYTLAGLFTVLNNAAIRNSRTITNNFDIDFESSQFLVNDESAVNALKDLVWCLTRSLQCLKNISNPGQIVLTLVSMEQEVQKECLSIVDSRR
jgi:hypothetical protein